MKKRHPNGVLGVDGPTTEESRAYVDESKRRSDKAYRKSRSVAARRERLRDLTVSDDKLGYKLLHTTAGDPAARHSKVSKLSLHKRLLQDYYNNGTRVHCVCGIVSTCVVAF